LIGNPYISIIVLFKNYTILLNFENLIIYADLCLVYKILHGLAPPVLCQFMSTAPIALRSTRSAARVPLRKSALGQTAFSVRAARE